MTPRVHAPVVVFLAGLTLAAAFAVRPRPVAAGGADNTMIHYVTAAGADSNDCLSWATSCATIQHAYDLLPSVEPRGGTIYVGGGRFDVGSGLHFDRRKPVDLIGLNPARQSSTTLDATWLKGGTVLVRQGSTYTSSLLSDRAIVSFPDPVGTFVNAVGFEFDNLIFEEQNPSLAGVTEGIYGVGNYGVVRNCSFFSKNPNAWGIYLDVVAGVNDDASWWRVENNWSQSGGLFYSTPPLTHNHNQEVISGNVVFRGTNPVSNNPAISLGNGIRSIVEANNIEGLYTLAVPGILLDNGRANQLIGNGGEDAAVFDKINNSSENLISDIGKVDSPLSTDRLVTFTGNSAENMVWLTTQGFNGAPYTTAIDDQTSTKINWYMDSSSTSRGVMNLPFLRHGNGSPEGVVSARPGTIYSRDDSPDNDHSLYIKGTGFGATGWRRVTTIAP